MSLNQLRAVILAAGTVVTAQADLAILDAAFNSVMVTLITFLGLLQTTHVADTVLFDIPFHEEAAAPYASYVRCSPHHHGSLNDTLHIYYY
jgi:hypothetical protein